MNTPASDTYLTLARAGTGEFKDRGSRFLGYAWQVEDEAAALERLDALRKEHFKARHHCFAWRFGREGLLFRANDDGEPSGTAGRPILGQIDALGMTNVVVVVVRYFGGVLLGASGLINAYREAAALALSDGGIQTIVIAKTVEINMDYALMPDVVQAIHQLGLNITEENFGERAHMRLSIRESQIDEALLRLRAKVLKVSTEEAAVSAWPAGMEIRELEN